MILSILGFDQGGFVEKFKYFGKLPTLLIVHVQPNANKDVNVCLDIFVITVVRVSLLVTVIAVA